MTNLEERYIAWNDAYLTAFANGDVEGVVALWAEDYTHTEINAFGEHTIKQGPTAVREYAEAWMSWAEDVQILKNELLGVGDGKGILNAELRWTRSDGKEYACNHICVIRLDEDDRCVSYTEWNVVKSRET